MDNVVQLTPPAPPAKPKKRQLKHSHFVERALFEHNNRILEAAAILKLVDEAASGSPDALTWESWDAVISSITAARRLLQQIDDLTDAEALAKVGTALVASGR